MSLDHKRVQRFQGEYLCLHCGKSWDIHDSEPPACTDEPASSMRVACSSALKASAETVSVLSHAFSNYGQPHRAVVAWSVEDGRGNTALLYAESRDDVLSYLPRVLPRGMFVQTKRLQAMDVHGHGRTPYFELNPLKLRMASNVLRRPVISLLRFKELQG